MTAIKPGFIVCPYPYVMAAYTDLRGFLEDLRRREDLVTVTATVDPDQEITELSRRSLRAGGPALLFTSVRGSSHAVLGNLFGTTTRVASAMGRTPEELSALGDWLASVREPPHDGSWREVVRTLPWLRDVWRANPRVFADWPEARQLSEGPHVDLAVLPITRCWPADAGRLISFGLVVTRGEPGGRVNLGVYRQQVIGRNRVILRWLPHRGGALDYAAWQTRHPDRPFPVAVAIGADPATLVAAVAPIPDTVSEHRFAGLLRGARSEVVSLQGGWLQVPASSEIVLEGVVHPGDTAPEGPFGDHTGHYNPSGDFPVMTVERMWRRPGAIYHTSYMGRSPDDEPSMLAMALNDVFVPLLRQVFPEIRDFYLPPEACSYRIAIVSIRKGYPGHARRIMMGLWSYLRQFTYTKIIIVTDDDVNVRSWSEVVWAMSVRVDPARDVWVVGQTAVDALDLATSEIGLGGKMGIDATRKAPPESARAMPPVITSDPAVIERMDALWRTLGIAPRAGRGHR